LRDFVLQSIFPENIAIAALIYQIPLVANKTPDMRPLFLISYIFRLILITIHPLKHQVIRARLGGLGWLLRET
jgi:hypothetical protein